MRIESIYITNNRGQIVAIDYIHFQQQKKINETRFELKVYNLSFLYILFKRIYIYLYSKQNYNWEHDRRTTLRKYIIYIILFCYMVLLDYFLSYFVILNLTNFSFDYIIILIINYLINYLKNF